MEPIALEYGSPTTPRLRWQWPWRLAIVVAVIVVAAGVMLPEIEVRRVESRIDAVTGSMTWNTVWLGGLSSSQRTDVSPLETRLKNGGIAWTPTWRFLHNTRQYVLGRSVGCGSAPPIYHLRPALKEFAAASSDAELAEFVRVMQTGSETQQQAAVDVAFEKALAALSPG